MRVQDLAEITSDPDALERFYRQHVEAVQRFVARRVDDPYLAADLTADVFVAAIESAGSYRRSRGEPVAWLYGIARNVVAGDRRRKAKELRTAAHVPTGANWSTKTTWPRCTSGLITSRPRASSTVS
jgi:DNA-directed RNA polymerase specialized sigma24 family protein